MLFIVTGLSGAGKSTALHALEDLGVFCTDNLPAGMLRHWAEVVTQASGDAAVGIDIRSTENPDLLSQALHAIRQDLPWKIIFMDAQDSVLQRRFSTVKRRHPYMPGAELSQAISAERKALQALYDQADIVLNSSRLTPYQLGELVESFWQKQGVLTTQGQAITCSVVSFSYQRGLPHGADMVLDMRFLPNPHYEPELAPLTGKDALVQAFFARLPEVREAEEHIKHWLDFIWPRLLQERKRYFTLAFGCSGGRHRSVYMAEQIAAWMQDKGMGRPIVRHRELGDVR